MYQFDIQALKRVMSEYQINAAELSRRIGVSGMCISRILRGERNPSTRVIAGLKETFPAYSIDYFFTSVGTDRLHE